MSFLRYKAVLISFLVVKGVAFYSYGRVQVWKKYNPVSTSQHGNMALKSLIFFITKFKSNRTVKQRDEQIFHLNRVLIFFHTSLALLELKIRHEILDIKAPAKFSKMPE